MMLLLLIQKQGAKDSRINSRKWQNYFRAAVADRVWPCPETIDNHNNQHHKYKSLQML